MKNLSILPPRAIHVSRLRAIWNSLHFLFANYIELNLILLIM